MTETTCPTCGGRCKQYPIDEAFNMTNQRVSLVYQGDIRRMKTKVRLTCNDNQYNDWEMGDVGYIDGYVRGGNNKPLACVVIGTKVVLCPLTVLEVIE